jgi:hypothetical protein
MSVKLIAGNPYRFESDGANGFCFRKNGSEFDES